MQEYFEIGQIVNTIGIKGFVKVVPFTDNVKRFDDLKSVLIVRNEKTEEYLIEEVKYYKHLVQIKFKGIDDINEAEKFKGAYLKIHRKDAVKLPLDSYFIADLIGLEVYTNQNEYFGKVEDIFSTKSNDVYVIKNELGKQILIPAIKTVIKEISIEKKRIIINVIEGLI
ncbi:MAG: ribosome maturation factor RimM [Oscillospiraceae bacterium]|nr:ribosome maturation factor RimM [Oscillospiraceae bacterium]